MKQWKHVLVVLLNLVAVTAPVSALYARYGIDERVTAGPGALGQLFSLGGAMLVGFAMAFVGSNLLKQAETNYTAVIATAIQSLAQDRKKAA